jgi:hypothetical protein
VENKTGGWSDGKANVEGNFCSFKKMTHTKSSLKIRKGSGGDYCPICRKPIDTEGEVYIIINNHKLYPNCWAHGSCVDELGIQEAAEAITYDYAEYKQMRNKFAAWMEDRHYEAALKWEQNRPPEPPEPCSCGGRDDYY